jgi:hypothetical protein
MQRDKNISKTPGVSAFEIVSDGIAVWFRNGEGYLYTVKSPGLKHVATLQRLARSGRGLSTYISRNAKMGYAAKLPPRAASR